MGRLPAGHARSVSVDQVRYISPEQSKVRVRQRGGRGGVGGERSSFPSGLKLATSRARRDVQRLRFLESCRAVPHNDPFQSLLLVAGGSAGVGTLRGRELTLGRPRYIIFRPRLHHFRLKNVLHTPLPHASSGFATPHHIPCCCRGFWEMADIRVRVHVQAAAYVRRQGTKPRSAHGLRRVAGKSA